MDKETGGSAFPTETDFEYHHSMTLRDYFAAKAMQSIVSSWIIKDIYPETNLIIAEHAYKIADAMLKAREQDA
jgi:hypothetical protein